MPASSLSTYLSWGIYVAASASLIIMLAPMVTGVYSASRIAAGSRTMDGIAEVIDGLRPGVSVSLSFTTTNKGDLVVLGGNQVAYVADGVTLYHDCRWSLPDASLKPGVDYSLYLLDDSVSVTPHG